MMPLEKPGRTPEAPDLPVTSDQKIDPYPSSRLEQKVSDIIEKTKIMT
jgi:hypothetical protein